MKNYSFKKRVVILRNYVTITLPVIVGCNVQW